MPTNSVNQVPYGSWNSPITADLIVAKTISFDMIVAGADDVYYLEVRPQEDGRYVLVQRVGDKSRDVIPFIFNARTRVHEYGGASFCVSNSVVFFTNYSDQRLYAVQAGATQLRPQAVTVEPEIPAGLRYADMIVDQARNCLYCVCEEHNEGIHEPQNYIARISLASIAHGKPVKPGPIAQGNSFYASLALSPDGKQIAFISWNHPNMPWDATTLMVASIADDGNLDAPLPITSGVDESIFQPMWGPDGALYYVSDRNGWWNLYRYKDGAHESLCSLEAEFGQPQWRFGYTTYGFHGNNEIICAVNRNAVWELHRLDLGSRRLTEIPTKYTDIQWVCVVGDKVIFRGASAVCPQEIVELDLGSGFTTVLKSSVDEKLLADISKQNILSIPEVIEFPTTGNRNAHAFYYAPKNPGYVGVEGTLPPLIVKCHGGPSGAASTMFNLEIQYWTSRGFAVADVNYGGSTGYGREYRQRLNGQWGVVDVEDAVSCAQYLAESGLVDKDKLLISGRSAGGYTVLCALTFKDVFAAGASYYGISDIEALAKDSHKFEAHYDKTLIAPYPEGQQLYRDRSAIHHTHRLNTPIVFFQGAEDKVVPPNQTIKMHEALKEKGVPCAMIVFEGERHGFSKAENVKQCLAGELYFYLRILGLPVPEGGMPPLTIFNEEKLEVRR